MDYHLKYRPQTLDEIVGQDEAVKMLRGFLPDKVPHCIMLTGPSGCGKTTAGRILKNEMGCDEKTDQNMDFVEINASNDRGINLSREIQTVAKHKPMAGKCRVYLIDEAHGLTGQAQKSFLKILEDTPKHAYFMLATTDPQNLIKTIHTRSTIVKFRSLTKDEIMTLLKRVIKAESLKTTKKIAEKIAKICGGSARKALVMLGSIANVEGEQEQLKVLDASDLDTPTEDLCKILMNRHKDWDDARKILLKLKSDDPDDVRRSILRYCSSSILNNWVLRS